MAWTTVATLEGLGDSTAAALINNSGTQTRAAISAVFGPSVAEQMAQDQTIEDAAVLAMQDAAVQAQLAWTKGNVGTGVDFNTIQTVGAYSNVQGSAPNQPVPLQGTLEVVAVGTGLIQRYTTYAIPAVVYTRRLSGTTWAAWSLQTWRTGEATSGYSLDGHVTVGHIGVNITNGIGQPVAVTGALETFALGSSGLIQRYTTYEATPRMFVRRGATSGAGSWGAWQQVTTQAMLDAVIATPAAGWKTTALAVTAGRAPADAPLTGTWRVPVHWNVPTRRFRVRISLRNARNDGAVQGAGVQLDGVWLGDHAGAGAFAAAPVQIAGAATIPDNGDPWISAWIDLPIGENVERLLSFSYTATTAPTYMVSYGWEYATKVASEVAPAGGVSKVMVPMDIHIEAEIPSTVPVLAVFGDSKSVGVGASRSLLDSTISQWCREHAAAPMHFASSGDALWVYAAGTWKIDRWDGVVDRPDYVLIELGINDLLSKTAAQMATDRATLVSKIQQRVSPEIGVVTIAPNETHTAAIVAERQAYNAALRGGLPSGINRLFDYDSVIALDSTTLRPEYDVDGLHLNAAGYAAEGTVMRHVVAPSRLS